MERLAAAAWKPGDAVELTAGSATPG
jgi:hypothetical protein